MQKLVNVINQFNMRWPPLFPKTIFHVFNRGVSKMMLFKKDADYKYFQFGIQKYKEKHNVEVLQYCIMPNHFHILIRTKSNIKNISIFMKYLQMSYACYFNRSYSHKGHVFESSYKNKNVNSIKYLYELKKYIYYNPKKDGLVKNALYWPYRS